MKTTTAVLSRDSADTIARTLETALALTDEVLVADTGSTDRTREVVAEFPGARWHEMPWEDSFAEARNAALDLVGEGLVVFLDSDEWVAEADRAAASETLRGLDGTGCWSPVVHDISGDHRAHHLPRILPADGGPRFRYRVHERLFLDQEECLPEELPIVVHHDGYTPQAQQRFDKQGRNLRLLRMDLTEHPDDPHPLFFWLRDGLATRSPQENRALIEQIDRLSTRSDRPRPFPVLARKVLLTQEWLERGAHPETVALAEGLAAIAPEDADAGYVLGVVALIEHHRAMNDELVRLARLRASTGDAVLQWGLTTAPRHLDAVIAEYLRSLGDARAQDYAKGLDDTWTDPYFDRSRRRGLT